MENTATYTLTEQPNSIDCCPNRDQFDRPMVTSLKWPSVYNQEMWEWKKEVFPWIESKEGTLGCGVYEHISHLGAFKTQHSSISNEWCSYLVTFNGKIHIAEE